MGPSLRGEVTWCVLLSEVKLCEFHCICKLDVFQPNDEAMFLYECLFYSKHFIGMSGNSVGNSFFTDYFCGIFNTVIEYYKK